MTQAFRKEGNRVHERAAGLRSTNWFLPLAVFLLALVIRAIAATRVAAIFNDGPTFIRIAGHMSEGRWAEALSHPYHPMYPLLMFVLSPVVPDLESAGVLISVFAGSVAVLALYIFLVAAYGQRLAIFGALLLALNPYAVRFAADVQSDSVYIALFLFAVAALYRALRDASFSLALAAGGLTGLAYLTRPEGLGVALVGTAMATASWLWGDWRGSRLTGWVASMAAGLAVSTIPYVLFIRSQSGAWSMSQKKSVIQLLGLGPDDLARLTDGTLGVPSLVLVPTLLLLVTAIRLGSRRTRTGPRPLARGLRIGGAVLAAVAVIVAIASAPAEAAQLASVLVSTIRPELLVLVVVGIASQVRLEPGLRASFISSFAGLYLVMLFALLLQYGYVSRRHALPLAALLMGYGAIGFSVIERSLRGLYESARSKPRIRRPIPLAIMVALLAAITLPKTFHDNRSEELAGRRAAEWLRSQDRVTAGLIASKRSKLGYYAKRHWQTLYEGTQPLSADELHARGVRFVIVEKKTLEKDQTARSTPSGSGAMTLVERHSEHARGYEAVLFELVPGMPHVGPTPSP